MKSAQTYAENKEKFCDNCHALLINLKECPECAPYNRMVQDCNSQILQIAERKNDAIRILASIEDKRRKSIHQATLLN
jgi:hypothetical protein